MRTLLIALSAACALPATAQAAEPRVSKTLTTLSPDAVRAATEVKEDPLEFHTIFSTEKVHRTKLRLFQTEGHDNHLRAIVDKRTGHTRYEVRTKISHWGDQPDYRSAHYLTRDGLKKADLTLKRDGGEFCTTNETIFTCSQSKAIAFDVDESVLREIAAGHHPEGWAFKIKNDAGRDLTSGIAPAEAAGLLQAVDQYRARTSAT